MGDPNDQYAIIRNSDGLCTNRTHWDGVTSHEETYDTGLMDNQDPPQSIMATRWVGWTPPDGCSAVLDNDGMVSIGDTLPDITNLASIIKQDTRPTVDQLLAMLNAETINQISLRVYGSITDMLTLLARENNLSAESQTIILAIVQQTATPTQTARLAVLHQALTDVDVIRTYSNTLQAQITGGDRDVDVTTGWPDFSSAVIP